MKKNFFAFAIFFLVLIFLFWTWFRGGFASVYLDTDIGRDLSELSNIWQHKIVWLGPQLSAGFPATPIYYYLFFPFLKIAGGNARAIIVANLLLAVSALTVFAGLAIQKYGRRALLAVALAGLFPWWISTAPHPGNGYTYVFWLFLGLSCLWFEVPLFIGAGLIGLAIAYHPAAIFAAPLLGYEWWRRGHKLLTLPFIFGSFLVGFGPLILFEGITKGYLLRQFLAHPNSSGIHFQFGIENLRNFTSSTGLPLVGVILLLLLLFKVSQSRQRFWLLITISSLFFLVGVSVLPVHYLLGILALFSFTTITALLQKKWGMIVLSILLSVMVSLSLKRQVLPASRSIPQQESVVSQLLATNQISKNQKIAVVAALSAKTEVPQADDYRFFLRMKDYQVLEVQDYEQADVLIMFIETPNFEWQSWRNWEIEQSPHQHIQFSDEFNGVKVAVWSK